MPQEVKADVLICGSGSAGLCAAVWLARAGIDYRVLERRSGPLQVGQADGVQARTVEILEGFGIEGPLLQESYHVSELAFWSPDGRGGIKSSSYAADLLPGLSHQPHVILSQARFNMLMVEDIRKSLGGEDRIEYGHQVQSVHVDQSAAQDPDACCVSVTSQKNGQDYIFKAKYVLGCDGAHSTVRKSLGIEMVGDSSDSMWGVMDVYARTDFPDIRKKSILHSDSGSLMIIPREGDSLVRFYLELSGAQADKTGFERLADQAASIFRPYSLEIVETVWWSTYSIGQRLADSFTVADRVFLTGDACHTHSPKAGQGMNVSLQDGHNLGWKLAAVLKGQASPSILETYVAERRRTAAELIEFDKAFTKLFSSKYRLENGVSAGDFEAAFVKSGRFTAGQATKYPESALTQRAPSSDFETAVLKLGMRFPTAHVVRQSDARSMQLVRAMPSDGRWHIVVFGGDVHDGQSAANLKKASAELEKLVERFKSSSDLQPDAVFNILLVLHSRRLAVGLDEIPPVFLPVTGKWQTRRLHNVFFDDQSYNRDHGQAYRFYGIDTSIGCTVIVRPDQCKLSKVDVHGTMDADEFIYIAKISTLDATSHLHDFFGAFMLHSNDA